MPPERVVIVNGTGSHRANTPEELASHGRAGTCSAATAWSTTTPTTRDDAAAGREVGRRRDRATSTASTSRPTGASCSASSSRTSWPASRAATRGSSRRSPTSRRSCATTTRGRSATRAAPGAVLEGNPTQAIIRHNGSLLPVDFCINVTLNRAPRDHALLLRRTRSTAHERAAPSRGRRPWSPASGRSRSWSRPTAATRSTRTSTRPSRACRPPRRSSREDGYIATASRCNDGFPAHGNFKRCSSITTRRARCSTRSRRPASRCSTSGRRSCSR